MHLFYSKQIIETQSIEVQKRDKIGDGFGGIGVMKKQLCLCLGKK